jgi:hypothetical protein
MAKKKKRAVRKRKITVSMVTNSPITIGSNWFDNLARALRETAP